MPRFSRAIVSLIVPACAFTLCEAAQAGQVSAIRTDPVVLNIGLVCQWQMQCMTKQNSAMEKSLKYVAKYKPPTWRVTQCNRNASRGGQRKDWIGFDKCVRNAELRYVPPQTSAPLAKRKRR